MMNYEKEHRSEAAKYITRRWFFQQCGVGLGSIALGRMLSAERALGASTKPAAAHPLAPHQPHFTGKARRVIYLFMGGAPSQLDLFDYKPSLLKYNGQPVPKEVVMGQKYAFIKPDAALFASDFKFAKHGLAVVFHERGLVVEQIDLARCAAHEEVDDALRLALVVRRAGRERIGDSLPRRRTRGIVRTEQRAQRNGAETHTALLQEPPARNVTRRFTAKFLIEVHGLLNGCRVPKLCRWFDGSEAKGIEPGRKTGARNPPVHRRRRREIMAQTRHAAATR